MPIKRKDRENRWMGRVKLQGKVITSKMFGKGRTEWRKALQWEETTKEALLAEQSFVTKLSLLDWVVSFLSRQKSKVSEKHYADCRQRLNRFLAYHKQDGEEIGGETTFVDSINLDAAECYLDEQDDVRSGYAANKDRMVLIKAWTYGQRRLDGFPTYENPFRLAGKYAEDRQDRYVPPLEDFWKVLEKAEGQDRVMLATLFYTAARKNEIFRLKWPDVDFRSGAIRLTTKKTRSGSLKEGFIPIGSDLREHLIWWRGQHPFPSAEYVFVQTIDSHSQWHQPGKPFKNRRNMMKRLCKEAKVEKFDIHSIRHLRAINLFRSGMPLWKVQGWLQHESSTTTERYLKRLKVDVHQLLADSEIADREATKILPFAKR